MNGFLNVYKEAGMTSHDVVGKLRKVLNIKTIGHTGTLDPNATGVLVVAVGRATKVIEYLEMDDKTYFAELTLGITTDTEDIWGKVLEKKDTNNYDISKKKIEETFNSFVGEIEQVPPMYSAIKSNGKKLYELAREGVVIDREARKITIFSITDIRIEENKVSFLVHCSKGTYIRTLCKDFGEKIGCGAVMSSLERVRAGAFEKSASHTLTEIEGNKEKYFIDFEYPLEKFEIIYLEDEESTKYRNGIKLATDKKDGKYRVYLNEKFYGICNVDAGIIKSEKRISEVEND